MGPTLVDGLDVKLDLPPAPKVEAELEPLILVGPISADTMQSGVFKVGEGLLPAERPDGTARHASLPPLSPVSCERLLGKDSI